MMKRNQTLFPLRFGKGTQKVSLYAPTTALPYYRLAYRLRGYRFRRLLIIGTEADIHAHNYRSNITPNALLGSVLSFEVRYDIPLVWEPDVQAAARLVERWAQRFAREAMKVSYEISKGPAPSLVSTAKIPVSKA